MARGDERAEVFHDAADYRMYLHQMMKAKLATDTHILHLALMPNHIHLQVLAGETGLSKFMHQVQNAYSKYYRKKYGNVGHVWQGRYKCVPILSDRQALACGNYIEMNPVRAGLVQDPAAWPYSSYRVYAYGEDSALIDRDPFYEELGEEHAVRQAVYRTLVVMTQPS